MIGVAYAVEYVHPLPDGHKFPMEKYSLLYEQLKHSGIIEGNEIEPAILKDEYLTDVHLASYVDRLKNLELSPREQRVSGFQHSKQLIEREFLIMEGTRRCAQFALENGAALNIAGGTHHAYTDKGEGFCLLNDQAIAANWLLKHTDVKKVLIVDLDVHQGNGTAEIFKEREEVFTFSMHGKNNYPLKKEISDLDVELEDGINDSEYLNLLETSLIKVKDQFNPDFVFFQSGVDILSTDKLGRLGLSIQGCRRRDQMVAEFTHDLGLPVVCTMGGGYSRDVRDIVNAHANTFEIIATYFG
ncbi:MAG: histone deacetylase [Crocinitomicaceae bacterium]